MARRKGDRWYIAGINGTDSARDITLDLSRMPGIPSVKSTLIADGADGWKIVKTDSVPDNISLLPRGGFVLLLQ